MMVVRLRQKSVAKETVHNTKPVATKYYEQRKEKLDKTRKPRIEIERKRPRNRPLLCQMPCSDRGIRGTKKAMHSIAIDHKTKTVMAIGNRDLPWVAGGSKT